METAADIVTSTVAEPVIDSVWRHIKYIRKYGDNIQSLKHQVEKLKDDRTAMLHKVDEAKRNAEEIEDKVTHWLAKVDETIAEAEKILEDNDVAEQTCFMGCRPSWMSRYQLSRKATKKKLLVDGVQEEGNFDRISYRTALDGVVPVKDYEAFESRTTIFNQMVDALKDGDVNMIGVYGMGGVGKTTLAKEVAERVKKDGVFTTVIMSTVTQKVDLQRIQQEIAEFLGLKLDLESTTTRAARLCSRLKNEEKILLILDDIWDMVKLEEIGIPFGSDHKGCNLSEKKDHEGCNLSEKKDHEGCNLSEKKDHKRCKILVTSRDLNVLRQMGLERNYFKLHVLGDGEAKSLFEKKVGPLDSELVPVASEIVKRCGGLPILIVAIATALKGKELYEWKDALERLKRCAEEEMDEVQSVLGLSYNFLKNDEMKLLFLLCGQLPFFGASIEDLLKYTVGLSLFKRSKTLEEARNRLLKCVSDLKSSCLLLEGNKAGLVKMHDVVRNFAVSVAIRDYHVFTADFDTISQWPPLNQCTQMHLNYIKNFELPTTLECPQLRLFVLYYHGLVPELKMSNDFFNPTKELRVLDLTTLCLSPLPSSIQTLENLTTLCLDHCNLGDISLIGKLEKLQVLSLVGSDIIELPRELGKLNSLQLLDLRRCYSLRVVPQNVLSKLVQLEHLLMGDSFKYWEGEGQGSNTSLSELRHLSNLVALEIHIIDANILRGDYFSKKLERFRIFIGDGWDWFDSDMDGKSSVLKLMLKTSIRVEEVKGLLNKTESLYLDELKGLKNVLGTLDVEGFPRLKQLYIQNNLEIEHIIDWQRIKHFIAFPRLESLSLENLKNLEMIYHGQFVMGSFSKLRILKVENCDRLKNLSSFTVLKGLVQLEEININHCRSLKEIVDVELREELDNEETMNLPQLRKLTLEDLPQLTGFCSQVNASPQNPATLSGSGEIVLENQSTTLLLLFSEKIQLPNLVDLKLSSINVEEIWPNQLTKLSSWIKILTTINVDSCGNLSYLFTSSMVESLQQLKTLEVSDCKSMKEVIVTKGEAMKSQVLFRELDSLKLKGLRSLIRFCTSKLIECPSLKVVQIENCPLLQEFVSSAAVTDAGSGSEVGQPNSTLFDEKVFVPNLEDLHIAGMQKLEKIWHDELHVDSFCQLKKLQVCDGKALLQIFPSKQLRRFKSLESLVIKDCDLVAEVFDLQFLMETQEQTASQLRYLDVRDLLNLQNIWRGDSHGFLSFCNLQKIHAGNCPSLKYLFPFSIAQSLPQIEQQDIYNCGLEEIVAKVERVEAVPMFAFPRLKSLDLWSLNELKCFYHGDHTLECPALEKLSVFDCKQLEVFHYNLQELQIEYPLFSSTEIVPNLKHLSLTSKDAIMIRQGQFQEDFFHKLKVIEINCFHDELAVFPFDLLERFRSMETLVVRCSKFKTLFPREELVGKQKYVDTLGQTRHLKLVNLFDLLHIWNQDSQLDQVLHSLETLEVSGCHRLITLAPSSASFLNLTTMDIKDCRGLSSLIPSSTARNLVQLKILHVVKCDMLSEIVSSDGNDGSKEEIIFSKLETLHLHCLSGLVSFCSAQHIFRFPSLTQVIVEICPKMQVFSSGGLATPMLRNLQVTKDDNKRRWSGNLNSTVQQLFKEMIGFSGLQHLKLSEFPQVKEVWNHQLPANLFCNLNTLVVDDCGSTSSSIPSNLMPFLNKLESLEVINCSAVERIFDLEGPNENGFVGCLSNLTSLTVHGCDNLEYLLSFSMIKRVVHLKRIEISDCKKMEKVIVSVAMEEQTVISEILLQELEFLKLQNLPKLKLVCTSDLINCPSMKKLQIENCPELATFQSNFATLARQSCSEFEMLTCTLFDDKILFPNLEELRIICIQKLKKIWHDELHVDSFRQLKKLQVYGGKALLQIFPSKQMRKFKSLESLDIQDCDLVEEVFDLQFLMETKEQTASQLRYLSARQLPNLQHVWKGDPLGFLSFCNLQKLDVWGCPNLKILFPFCIAQSLPQFEHMHIVGCGIDKIVANVETVEAAPSFAFPQLKSLYLWSLKELKCFYQGTHTLQCPALENLNVCYCDQLKVFHYNLQETQMEYPLFSFTEIVPNLKRLTLTSKDAIMIRQGQFQEDFFHKLEDIEITHFLDEFTIFPFDLLEKFRSIKMLCIRCSNFKEMFPREELVGKKEYVDRLGQIQFLLLANLPYLEHIWNHDSQLDQVLHTLETLIVACCPRLITLAPPTACFLNLTFIDVMICQGLASLMTSSTARSLVQLTRLSITDCSLLTEIVVNEGDDGSEEEIIFNKLESLQLVHLPSLVSFCSAQHSFGFPSLTQVIVEQCPKMQVFSNGVLTTPKLQTLQVTKLDDKGRWNGNLNATIQQLFIEMNPEETELPSIMC